jgi:hypothetical protein
MLGANLLALLLGLRGVHSIALLVDLIGRHQVTPVDRLAFFDGRFDLGARSAALLRERDADTDQ